MSVYHFVFPASDCRVKLWIHTTVTYPRPAFSSFVGCTVCSIDSGDFCGLIDCRGQDFIPLNCALLWSMRSDNLLVSFMNRPRMRNRGLEGLESIGRTMGNVPMIYENRKLESCGSVCISRYMFRLQSAHCVTKKRGTK